MQCDVRDPNVAMMIDGHAMWKIEERSSPRVQNFAVCSIQFQNGVNVDWSNVCHLIVVCFIERSANKLEIFLSEKKIDIDWMFHLLFCPNSIGPMEYNWMAINADGNSCYLAQT